MKPEKIRLVAEAHLALLRSKGVVSKRIDTSCSFSQIPREGLLAHASYLLEGLLTFVNQEGKYGKANRHLTAAQMCLSFAGIYTLDELREANKP